MIAGTVHRAAENPSYLTDSSDQYTQHFFPPKSVPRFRCSALQLKHGEIHSTVYAAAVLTGNEYALEVQMSAYSLLQYLVSSQQYSSLGSIDHTSRFPLLPQQL